MSSVTVTSDVSVWVWCLCLRSEAGVDIAVKVLVGMATIYKLFALRRSPPILEAGLIQSVDGLASQKQHH